MPTIFDAVDVDAIPPYAEIILAYIDGEYPTYTKVRARFPAARILTITTKGDIPADICDVERYDATPEIGAAGVKAGLYPTLYSDTSTGPSLRSLLAGVPWDWFAADPTGVPHIVDGAVATQYAWPAQTGGNYDVSLSIPSYPFVAPEVPKKESNMIAHNSKGGGYWVARPNGGVYAFGGAPYLGPAIRFVQGWGIGTAQNPVVGIADDGNGGYTLAADNGVADDPPALYHFDATQLNPDGTPIYSR
jgi:hypothetical protein